jgi:hypothetical protein
VFGSSEWALMFILAKGGQTYSRLRFNVGPGGEQLLKTEIDFGCLFGGSDLGDWTQEYEANASVAPLDRKQKIGSFRNLPGEGFETGGFFQGRRARRFRDDEELQEALLSEYAEYWGLEREDF